MLQGFSELVARIMKKYQHFGMQLEFELGFGFFSPDSAYALATAGMGIVGRKAQQSEPPFSTVSQHGVL